MNIYKTKLFDKECEVKSKLSFCLRIFLLILCGWNNVVLAGDAIEPEEFFNVNNPLLQSKQLANGKILSFIKFSRDSNLFLNDWSFAVTKTDEFAETQGTQLSTEAPIKFFSLLSDDNIMVIQNPLGLSRVSVLSFWEKESESDTGTLYKSASDLFDIENRYTQINGYNPINPYIPLNEYCSDISILDDSKIIVAHSHMLEIWDITEESSKKRLSKEPLHRIKVGFKIKTIQQMAGSRFLVSDEKSNLRVIESDTSKNEIILLPILRLYDFVGGIPLDHTDIVTASSTCVYLYRLEETELTAENSGQEKRSKIKKISSLIVNPDHRGITYITKLKNGDVATASEESQTICVWRKKDDALSCIATFVHKGIDGCVSSIFQTNEGKLIAFVAPKKTEEDQEEVHEEARCAWIQWSFPEVEESAERE